MTKAQAIERLEKTRTLSTGMLKPLSIPFEAFLRFSILSPERQNTAITVLINGLNKETKRV